MVPEKEENSTDGAPPQNEGISFKDLEDLLKEQSPPVISKSVKPPEVKEPVKPPEAKEPVKPPEAKEPVKPPEAKEPVKPPEVKEPVKPPEVKEPVKPPEVKEPVKPPEVKEPVKPPEVKIAAGLPEALYRQALDELDRLARVLLEGKQPDLSLLVRIVTDFVEALSSSSRLLIISFTYTGNPFYPLLNSINNTILAIKLGMGLNYEKKDLIKLGIACLFHDVGMWKIPRELILKPGPLTSSEQAEIKRHPIYNKEMVKALPSEYEWLQQIADQTHERDNGSGYPHGLHGQAIHEFAKIIGLVDMYESMTHYRPYRPDGMFPPDEAVKTLLRGSEWKDSKELVKALVQQLTVFPPGSWVRLNTGEIAQVIETNPLTPLRPKVEVRFNTSQMRLQNPKAMDMNQDPLIYITGCILSTKLPEKD